MKLHVALCAISVSLATASHCDAVQSAVWFSPDGHFPEYADPSTRLVDSFPVADYGPGDTPGGRSQTSVGWTFQLTEPASLEALGVYDYGADGLLADHLVGLWKIPDLNGLDQAEPIAMSLVESGAGTPFDGQWRYSEDLFANTLSGSVLGYPTGQRHEQLVDPIYGSVALEAGDYALISSQIASETNRDAIRFESADLIDLYWFIEPFLRSPGHDPRLNILEVSVPIGPDAYDSDALGEPYEFFPTNVQLFNSMMVGPTLFLAVPEPSCFLLAVLMGLSAQASSGRRRS